MWAPAIPKRAVIAAAYGANTPLRRTAPPRHGPSPRCTTPSPSACSRRPPDDPAQPVRAARPHPASAAARTPAAAAPTPAVAAAGEEVLVPFNCRLPADIRRALKRHAAEHDTRIQDIVAAALRSYLREH